MVNIGSSTPCIPTHSNISFQREPTNPLHLSQPSPLDERTSDAHCGGGREAEQLPGACVDLAGLPLSIQEAQTAHEEAARGS